MQKSDPKRMYFALSFLANLGSQIAFTTSIIYRMQVVGLDPLQLVLVGTVLELTVFLFEIPTGVVADVYSRKLSSTIGRALVGIGFMVEGIFPSFGFVLASQVLWGFGWTFISGAHSAWITDEVGSDKVGDIFLNARNYEIAGSLVAIPASIWAAKQSLALPFLIGGSIYLLSALYSWLFMPETGFSRTPPESRETWKTLVKTTTEGFQQIKIKKSLMIYAIIALFIGLYSEGWDRLSEAFLLENFTFPTLGYLNLGTVEWFNLFAFIGLILGIFLTQYSRKKLDSTKGDKLVYALQIIHLAMFASMLIFVLSGNFITAILAMIIFDGLRGLSFPLSRTWINLKIESKNRATILSMTGQVDALGQMVGGPGIGAVGRLRSIKAAIITAAIILFPSVPLFSLLRNSDNNQE